MAFSNSRLENPTLVASDSTVVLEASPNVALGTECQCGGKKCAKQMLGHAT